MGFLSYASNVVSAVAGVGNAVMDYAAAAGSDKRKTTSGRIVREESVLPQGKRQVISAGLRDLDRNLSMVGWAVRKHLDYNTQFGLQSQTENEEFDIEFEKFFDEISTPEECDVSGRNSFFSMLRMIESSALLDGDCGILKLASGHIQGIESDLVRNPSEVAAGETWFNGVRVTEANRPVGYGLHKRGAGGRGYDYVKTVSASSFYLHGYFSRFDQCRGVSPLAAAVNDFQDFYEGKDLALAKLKVQQFFAVQFFRDAVEGVGQYDDTEAVDEDGVEVNRAGYKVDFGKGPAMLDMNDGDRAEFLEGSTPATSTQDFLMLVCQIALKALDLPFSFFNESFTNFFGSRSAWIHYERSCEEKRGRLIRLADDWLRWRVAIAIKTGRLKVPADILAAAGPGIKCPWWEFVPRGVPWWDPSKEVDAAARSVEEAFSSRQRVCRQGGTDFYENIRQRKREEAFAEKMGVKLGKAIAPAPLAAPGGPPAPGSTPAKPEDDEQKVEDNADASGDDADGAPPGEPEDS